MRVLPSIGLLILLLSLAWCNSLSGQQPPDWQKLFDPQALDEQVNRVLPPFLREISPEEQARLEKVNVSVREEQALGRAVLKQTTDRLSAQGLELTRRGADVTYLKKLVVAIQPQMTNAPRYRRVRVNLIPVDHADAFSIPGGDLLVTQGLVENARSEATLVGVLAHELSHLDRGHQLYGLRQRKLAERKTDWSSQLQAFGSLMKPFHPEFERQADADAVRWMLALEYDPRELAHLLEAWDQRQDNQAPWMEFLPGLVRSHPDAGKRARRVLELDAAAPAGQVRYVGRENLERRVPRTEQEFVR